jgi:uncharacterized protein (DUF1499 family)
MVCHLTEIALTGHGRSSAATLHAPRNGILAGLIILLLTMPIFSCSGKRPTDLGRSDSGLAPCPDTPNCVSSDSPDPSHHVPPLTFNRSQETAWAKLVSVVTGLPRTRIVVQSDTYLHAECSSAVFGFVDDLEFDLRGADGIIAVRSAARLGSSDLGVNRRRVEKIRRLLVEQEGAL